jgi:uncharacterized protein YndB with AHSA1/START domain
MEIVYGTFLRVPVEEAFAFVSDPATWPRFFSGLRSAEAGEGWGAPGGRARTVTRFLGRDVESDLQLVEWDPPHRFRYTMTHPGRPTLDSLRVFEEVPGGTRFTGTSEATPRPGIRGVYDRLQLRMVERVFDRSMRDLATVIVAHHPTS